MRLEQRLDAALNAASGLLGGNRDENGVVAGNRAGDAVEPFGFEGARKAARGARLTTDHDHVGAGWPAAAE